MTLLSIVVSIGWFTCLALFIVKQILNLFLYLEANRRPKLDRNVEALAPIEKREVKTIEKLPVRPGVAGTVYQGDMLDYCRISCSPRPYWEVADRLAHFPLSLN